MKLIVDTRRFKELHDKGVSGWELITFLLIEETVTASDGGWTPLPQSFLEKELGMTAAQQSRTLTGLQAHGLIQTKRVGFGDVRRFVQLTRTATAN